MRKGRDGEKKKKKKGKNGKNGGKKKEEKTDENSGPYVVCQQSTARTATPERRPLERRTLVPISPVLVNQEPLLVHHLVSGPLSDVASSFSYLLWIILEMVFSRNTRHFV